MLSKTVKIHSDHLHLHAQGANRMRYTILENDVLETFERHINEHAQDGWCVVEYQKIAYPDADYPKVTKFAWSALLEKEDGETVITFNEDGTKTGKPFYIDTEGQLVGTKGGRTGRHSHQMGVHMYKLMNKYGEMSKELWEDTRMTCTCTADHKCLFCAGVTTNDNPFTDAGALLIESLESRGKRAYGPQWPALRTHMTATHSDGRTSNTGALRHDEAIAMIDVIRTECPHAFAMKKNWKPANPDYKRPPSKATPPLVEFSGGIPLPPTVVNLKYDKFDIRIDRRSEYGNPFRIRETVMPSSGSTWHSRY